MVRQFKNLPDTTREKLRNANVALMLCGVHGAGKSSFVRLLLYCCRIFCSVVIRRDTIPVTQRLDRYRAGLLRMFDTPAVLLKPDEPWRSDHVEFLVDAAKGKKMVGEAFEGYPPLWPQAPPAGPADVIAIVFSATESPSVLDSNTSEAFTRRKLDLQPLLDLEIPKVAVITHDDSFSRFFTSDRKRYTLNAARILWRGQGDPDEAFIKQHVFVLKASFEGPDDISAGQVEVVDAFANTLKSLVVDDGSGTADASFRDGQENPIPASFFLSSESDE